jgi:cytochrome c peroxidase
MLRFKQFVLLFFVLFAVMFYGHRLITTPVSSQESSSSLSAPTGVVASDGHYADKVGVMWNTVRGATTYRVFRNTSNNPAGSTDVGTTAAGYFFDTSAAVNQTYFYFVRAENSGANSDFSQSDQGLRASGTVPQSGFFLPLNPPIAPNGNAVTATKASLGKALFWDEQLSSTRTVSCGTCHRASEGGSDPRTRINDNRSRHPGFDNVFNTPDDVFGSPGVPMNNLDGTYSLNPSFGFNPQVTGRKAPSYLNAGYSFSGLFWDGRASAVFRDPITNAIVLDGAASLESQILGPPVNSSEMGHGGRNWTQVASQIADAKPLALASNIPLSLSEWINGRTYAQLFEEAFGTPEVTPSRIAMAIATHERTLFSDQTPLDKWASQIEPLTAQENRGREVYLKAQCNNCHAGEILSDNNFHNIGVRPVNEDLGRAAVTNNSDDNARFKTPGLRNVELRAPYMHNGRFATLEQVVEFYNRGGDFDAPNIDHSLIRPLGLSPQERADLVAFMKRPMTDVRVANELPPFDRPQLYSESNRVPVISGVGRAGLGGITPRVTAIEPPMLGNPSFTVGVSTALAGAQAVLVIDSTDPGVGTSIPASGSFARQTINLSGVGNSGYASISLPIPNNPALIGQTFFGRWYVTDSGAANGFAVSQAFRFTIFGTAAQAPNRTPFDFDGDGRTDVSVFRPSNGGWYISNSSNNTLTATAFGLDTDLIAPADYDADGRTDIAVFRPSSGTWYLLQSTNGFAALQFGQAGDKPQPGDYDGDGRADLAVFRPSNGAWYIQRSRDGFTGLQFGQTGDKPVAADYDGDNKTDVAVYRAGTWYLLRSTLGFTGVAFGAAEDKPVTGDYDADGKADVAVFRPSNGFWYLLRSSDGAFSAAQFGAASDVPAPGDYDGDRRTDYAVFRPAEGNWYIRQSSDNGFRAQLWGVNHDQPVPSAFLP